MFPYLSYTKSVEEPVDYKTEPPSPEKLILLNKIQETLDRIDVISDPDFSLVQLAHLVESNTSYVSGLINETFGKNFKTYLNERRIQEACRRLNEDSSKRLTMAAIANEVGFKTQNSFITNFKKVMGMTPSSYRKIMEG